MPKVFFVSFFSSFLWGVRGDKPLKFCEIYIISRCLRDRCHHEVMPSRQGALSLSVRTIFFPSFIKHLLLVTHLYKIRNPFCRSTRMSFLSRNLTATSPRSRRHKLRIAHFRASHEKFAHSVVPPLPKKSIDFSGAPTVLAKSYPIRTVIQLSYSKRSLR